LFSDGDIELLADAIKHNTTLQQLMYQLSMGDVDLFASPKLIRSPNCLIALFVHPSLI